MTYGGRPYCERPSHVENLRVMGGGGRSAVGARGADGDGAGGARARARARGCLDGAGTAGEAGGGLGLGPGLAGTGREMRCGCAVLVPLWTKRDPGEDQRHTPVTPCLFVSVCVWLSAARYGD